MNAVAVAGRLATSEGVRHGRVVVEDGVIARVDDGGEADHVFGDDCLVFAGMGDVHVHARQDPTGTHDHKETFATAAAAALHGGVVHLCEMPNNPAPPIDEASYAAKAALAPADCPVGYVFYAGIGPRTQPLRRAVPYKAFMGPSVGDLFFTSLDQLDDALARYRGKSVTFHCEDPELLDRHAGAATHEDQRPPECEIRAIDFAVGLADRHGLAVKVAHVSTAGGWELIADAKSKGVQVQGEVTPHHCFFDTTMLTPESRPWLQMNPPLRSPADRRACLAALRDGVADYFATDHAPHTVAENEAGVSGQPHLDTFGPFLTWLLAQGVTPQRIAALCSENPGRFVAPYTDRPQGLLVPGHAGSLTVLNVARPTRLTNADVRTRCGWTPFADFTFPGGVEAVFVRGELQDR